MGSKTLFTTMVSLILTHGSALAADQAAFTAAMAEAKAAVATANHAGGEWRDTGKIMKEAEKAAAAGDYDKAVMLANKAKLQGLLGAQQANEQANAGNPDYLYK